MTLPSFIMLAVLFAPVEATVEEMMAAPQEYHGKEVIIDGWVLRCGGHTCAIRDNRKLESPSLSIAAGTSFDADVGYDRPVRVQLQAIVDATCFSGEYVCLDRPPELTPTRWKVKY